MKNDYVSTRNSRPYRLSPALKRMIDCIDRRFGTVLLALAAFLAGSPPLRAHPLLDEADQDAANGRNKRGSVTIVSPRNNTIVTARHVLLEVRFSNEGHDREFKALLNGTDITSRFGSERRGIRRALLSPPDIRMGKNDFLVTAGQKRQSDVRFIFNPNAAPGATWSAGPLLVPIQTRVLAPGTDGSRDTDYEIVVGDSITGQTVYQAQASYDHHGAFQILLLNRTDLSLVENFTADTDTELAIEGMVQQLSPTYTNVCGTNGQSGCLVIIQSLSTIGTTCTSGILSQQTCYNYINAFSNMGATSALPTAVNGSNPHVAYSFIGNSAPNGKATPIPLVPGTFYERLTCSDASGCDNGQLMLAQTAPAGAPASQIGNISGVLVRDNMGLYTFRPNQPQVTFSSVYDPNAQKNTVIVGKVQAESSDLSTLGPGPNGEIGGFHLVVFDTTGMENGGQPTTAYNETYTVHYIPPSNLPDTVHNITQLAADIGMFKSQRYLFFLSSVGTLGHPEGCPNYNNKNNCTDYADPNYMGNWVVCPSPLQCRGFAGIDIWDQVNVSLYQLFGTDYATFELLDHPPAVSQQTNPFGTNDDYKMVSRLAVPTSQTNVRSPYPIEVSSIISAQTVANPVASNVAGVLQVDHGGYYQPKLANQYDGLTPEIVISLGTASLWPNIPWPLTGPGSTSGQQAAYAWISQKICESAATNCNTPTSND
ncbi:MAG: hypothetical protein JOY85_09295, partial [Acidobacteriaceae bacterium]|nr:hypothetical protein [Acidobacteriaceae bacterium]